MVEKKISPTKQKPELKKTLGMLSMIFGITGLVLSALTFFDLPFVLASIILGIIALIKINQKQASGKGMAIAGLATGGTALLVIIIIIIVTASTVNQIINSAQVEKTESPKTSETTEPEIKELSPYEKMLDELMDLVDEELAYDTGDYVKGEIKPGEYAFSVLGTTSSSYYSEEDASGEIIDNANFGSFGYVKVHGAGDVTTRGILVNVSALEKIGVKGAKELYEVLNEQKDYNQTGYYKVGLDLEPGTYVVESLGGNGYYSINSGPVGDSDIVDNDSFKGKSTVNLRAGQFIEISRATIK